MYFPLLTSVADARSRGAMCHRGVSPWRVAVLYTRVGGQRSPGPLRRDHTSAARRAAATVRRAAAGRSI